MTLLPSTQKPKPFGFDIDLAGENQTVRARLARAEEALADEREAHAKALVEAKEAGFRDGQASAKAQAAKAQADALKALQEHTQSLLSAQETGLAKLSQEAAVLAHTVGAHLAEAALANYPEAELTAMLRKAFQDLQSTPHLIVHLPQDHAEATKTALNTLLDETGYAGRLVVKQDPELAAGDVRLVWASGEISRDRKAAEAHLLQLINTYFEVAA